MDYFELKNKTAELFSFIKNENLPVYGVQIFKNNQLLDNYGDTKSPYPVYSVTKSIVSLGIGIAEKEGFLNLDDCILKYIPENYLCELCENQHKLFENISLKRLLTMSVKGFSFRPSGNNWLLHSLNSSIKPEKIEFHYTNISAYLIGIALTTAVKCSADKYITEKILSPLEIKNPIFHFSPEGFMNGAWGMELSIDQVSRIGLMLMNKGVYNNNRILPEEYLNKACNVQIMNKDGGYGYFFWKFADGFYMNGKWGQKCFCIPSQNIMITTLGNFQNGSEVLKNKISEWFI